MERAIDNSQRNNNFIRAKGKSNQYSFFYIFFVLKTKTIASSIPIETYTKLEFRAEARAQNIIN